MAVSDDLLMAILSMDAYNRGVGTFHLTGLTGDRVGNAVLRTDPLPLGSPAMSFSAQAYDWNGQKVISYRGTDTLTDVLTGWVTGAGIMGPQAQLAAQFYQLVGRIEPKA